MIHLHRIFFFLEDWVQNSIQDWVFLPFNEPKKVLRIHPAGHIHQFSIIFLHLTKWNCQTKTYVYLYSSFHLSCYNCVNVSTLIITIFTCLVNFDVKARWWLYCVKSHRETQGIFCVLTQESPRYLKAASSPVISTHSPICKYLHHMAEFSYTFPIRCTRVFNKTEVC